MKHTCLVFGSKSIHLNCCVSVLTEILSWKLGRDKYWNILSITPYKILIRWIGLSNTLLNFAISIYLTVNQKNISGSFRNWKIIGIDILFVFIQMDKHSPVRLLGHVDSPRLNTKIFKNIEICKI